MPDLTNQPLNDDPGDQRALEHTNRSALVSQPGAMDYRTELYARLRTIIDNATESIRVLRDENAALITQNAEMSNQIGTLEQRLRVVTMDLASDELALRKSAEVLEQVMKGNPSTPAAPAAMSPARADSSSHAAADTIPARESPAVTPAMPEPELEPEKAALVTEPAASSPTADTGPIPQPEPTAPFAPVEPDERERAIAPRRGSEPDGTYTVIASPFVRFSDLGQFQAALQKLTGVHDVQVRRFAQGTLEMRIGYSGATDLATTLRMLATEVEDVHEEEPYQLRVRLRSSQD